MDDPEYEALVDRVIAATEGDRRILALLVYGSHAAGNADSFSDLDVGLVVPDDAFDDVIADVPKLARDIGEPLLIEDFGDPGTQHVILADGSELELIFQRERDVTPDRPLQVLFDRAGVVERARGRAPATIEPHRTDPEALRRLVQWFWHDVGHLVTALGRGQTWWAYGQLDELRSSCLNLSRLEAGQPTEDEAYWKIEEAITPARLAAFAATVAPPERGPMLDAGLALVELYRDLARPMAAAHGIPYPDELDRLVSTRLHELGDA